MDGCLVSGRDRVSALALLIRRRNIVVVVEQAMVRLDHFSFIRHMASVLARLDLTMAVFTCDCHVLRVIPLCCVLMATP